MWKYVDGDTIYYVHEELWQFEVCNKIMNQ